MRESGDRGIDIAQPDIFDSSRQLPPIRTLAKHEPPLAIVPYSFRSFDRQWLLADGRLISRPRQPLWAAHSKSQVYFASLFNHPLGDGPAVSVCAEVPDMHFFRGSFGAKEIMPLYRDASGVKPNIAPGLLELLGESYGRGVSPGDFAGYVYGVLAQPEYTRRFADELARKEVRVPLTKNGRLFAKTAAFGRELIWLHTYGERLHDAEHPKGQVPQGEARCVKAVSGEEARYPNEFHYTEATETLYVGDGSFAPVSPAVWQFEVSGLKVVQSWLGYRMKDRSGKKSSPLDDIGPKSWTREFTRELLELLWVIEKTIAGYPKQKQLLEAVLGGELFRADELPPVPDSAREAPKVPKAHPRQGRLI